MQEDDECLLTAIPDLHGHRPWWVMFEQNM